MSIALADMLQGQARIDRMEPCKTRTPINMFLSTLHSLP